MPRRARPRLASNQCKPSIRWREFFELRRHQSPTGTRADDCDIIWTACLWVCFMHDPHHWLLHNLPEPTLENRPPACTILVSLLLQN